jgi:DNA replication protein DnaC
VDVALEDLCKQLRLSGVYNYVQECSSDNDDLQEFLISALQAELDKRRMNRQMRSLRLAGFPTKKRFEDLIMDDLPQDGREAIPALKSLEFLKERRNVILIGNYRVAFRTAAGLINEMVEARNENRLSVYIKQFRKIDLLIIDELGYVTFDLTAAELLFQLLATRYETMSTIITSNLAFSDWVKVFHDRTLTAAILDRITHHALILNMNGKSFRRR